MKGTPARTQVHHRRTATRMAREYVEGRHILQMGRPPWVDLALDELKVHEALLEALEQAEPPPAVELFVGMHVVILRDEVRRIRKIMSIGRKWVQLEGGERMPRERPANYCHDGNYYFLSAEEERYACRGLYNLPQLLKALNGFGKESYLGLSMEKRNKLLVYLQHALKE